LQNDIVKKEVNIQYTYSKHLSVQIIKQFIVCLNP